MAQALPQLVQYVGDVGDHTEELVSWDLQLVLDVDRWGILLESVLR